MTDSTLIAVFAEEKQKMRDEIDALRAQLEAVTTDRDEWKDATVESNKRFKIAEAEAQAQDATAALLRITTALACDLKSSLSQAQAELAASVAENGKWKAVALLLKRSDGHYGNLCGGFDHSKFPVSSHDKLCVSVQNALTPARPAPARPGPFGKSLALMQTLSANQLKAQADDADSPGPEAKPCEKCGGHATVKCLYCLPAPSAGKTGGGER